MIDSPLLQPGQLEAPAGDFPELRLPSATLFRKRSQRFYQLAEGHSLSDYLHFLAVLAEHQQRELDNHPGIPVPDTTQLQGCRIGAKPPLDATSQSRHPHWRQVARNLANAVFDKTPKGGQEEMALLYDSEEKWLDVQADNLLARKFHRINLATAPIIGAALQIQWTYLTRQLGALPTAWQVQPTHCPVCGGHPVASVIRKEGAVNGLRYLHCALCGSEWHMVRSKCSNCMNTKDVTYYGIEGRKDIINAETCPVCLSYLKVIHQDREPRIEPAADDLASFDLDLLMGEKNIAKNGINFMMIQGQEE